MLRAGSVPRRSQSGRSPAPGGLLLKGFLLPLGGAVRLDDGRRSRRRAKQARGPPDRPPAHGAPPPVRHTAPRGRTPSASRGTARRATAPSPARPADHPAPRRARRAESACSSDSLPISRAAISALMTLRLSIARLNRVAADPCAVTNACSHRPRTIVLACPTRHTV